MYYHPYRYPFQRRNFNRKCVTICRKYVPTCLSVSFKCMPILDWIIYVPYLAEVQRLLDLLMQGTLKALWVMFDEVGTCTMAWFVAFMWLLRGKEHSPWQ